jgi:small-conductance mechanosensitive channel
MDITTNKEMKKETGQVKDTRKHKLWIATYITGALICVVAYLSLQIRFFGLLGTYRKLLQHLALAGFFVFLVLMVSKALQRLVTKRGHTRAVQYNVVRLIRLLSFFVALLIIITFLFQNWYTAAVSLGLFSLILGFALQSPISSLIGWFYIIIRAPYKVGDRIQVGEFTGDVVEISYLDTTLWEFAGNYLTNDLPSGRLIRFPNTLVFQSQIYNYTWNKFPYIWNEIPFHVAYTSDLPFIETTVKEVAKRELGADMAENIKIFRDLLQQTPIDEMEVKEYPFVNFRVNANTWIEVLVTYLVKPKKASATRTRLIKAILDELNKSPEKVQFPKGDSR